MKQGLKKQTEVSINMVGLKKMSKNVKTKDVMENLEEMISFEKNLDKASAKVDEAQVAKYKQHNHLFASHGTRFDMTAASQQPAYEQIKVKEQPERRQSTKLETQWVQAGPSVHEFAPSRPRNQNGFPSQMDSVETLQVISHQRSLAGQTKGPSILYNVTPNQQKGGEKEISLFRNTFQNMMPHIAANQMGTSPSGQAMQNHSNMSSNQQMRTQPAINANVFYASTAPSTSPNGYKKVVNQLTSVYQYPTNKQYMHISPGTSNMTVQIRKKNTMDASQKSDELLEAEAAEVLSRAVNDCMKASSIAHKIVVKNQEFHLPEHQSELFVPIYTDGKGNIQRQIQDSIKQQRGNSKTEQFSQSMKQQVGKTKSKMKVAKGLTPNIKESPVQSRQSNYAVNNHYHQTMPMTRNMNQEPIREEALHAPSTEESPKRNPPIHSMQDLIKQQQYKDPFQRLKPSIKPLYNQHNTNKFSKKSTPSKDSSNKKNVGTKLSPRSSLLGKSKKKSTSPRQSKHFVLGGQFSPTDVMSDEIRLEDEEDNYTVHQQSVSRLHEIYTISELQNRDLQEDLLTDSNLNFTARVSINKRNTNKTNKHKIITETRANSFNKAIKLVKMPLMQNTLDGEFQHQRFAQDAQANNFKEYLDKNMPLSQAFGTTVKVGSLSPVMSGKFASMQNMANNVFPDAEDMGPGIFTNSTTQGNYLQMQAQGKNIPMMKPLNFVSLNSIGIQGGAGSIGKDNLFQEIIEDNQMGMLQQLPASTDYYQVKTNAQAGQRMMHPSHALNIAISTNRPVPIVQLPKEKFNITAKQQQLQLTELTMRDQRRGHNWFQSPISQDDKSKPNVGTLSSNTSGNLQQNRIPNNKTQDYDYDYQDKGTNLTRFKQHMRKRTNNRSVGPPLRQGKVALGSLQQVAHSMGLTLTHGQGQQQAKVDGNLSASQMGNHPQVQQTPSQFSPYSTGQQQLGAQGISPQVHHVDLRVLPSQTEGNPTKIVAEIEQHSRSVLSKQGKVTLDDQRFSQLQKRMSVPHR